MPAEMVLDTSFVVEALVPSQRLHAPCQQFLRRLSEGDSTIFFNRLLEIELREAVFQIALKERHAKEWRRFRHDGRARRRADRLLSQVDKA